MRTTQEIDRTVMKRLEALTPMGSEFYNDPHMCLDWIERELKVQRNLTKEAYLFLNTRKGIFKWIWRRWRRKRNERNTEEV